MDTVLTIHTPKNVIPRVEERILEIYKGNILTEIIGGCPVDYGYLRQHWWTEQKAHQVRIYNNTKYAAWISRGTGLFGPYHTMIKPKTKKALAWKGAGGLKICRRATKGMEANPYVENGIAAGVRRSVSDLKVILGEEEI